jgi:hypothetical protein
MAEKAAPIKKLTDKSTKQEMLEAYQALARQLDEKRQAELNPERRSEERKAEEALKTATTVAADGIDREIGTLKSEIGKMLADVSEKLGAEAARFRGLQKAVETKQQELQELYGIEKSASTLVALIETQNQKRRDFEEETERQRDDLKREMDETRLAWQKERQAHDAELREREAAEKKAREREKEQFEYAFKREQQSLRDKLNDEKSALEKQLRAQKEASEKDLAEREQMVVEKETSWTLCARRPLHFPGN